MAFGIPCTALAMKRGVLPALLAVAVTLAITPVATAEWDVGEYDFCMQVAEQSRIDGETGAHTVDVSTNGCCVKSGGIYDGSNGPNGTCGAPPAVAADVPIAPPSEAANPDVPAAAPATPKPGPKAPPTKSTFTLAPIAPVG